MILGTRDTLLAETKLWTVYTRDYSKLHALFSTRFHFTLHWTKSKVDDADTVCSSCSIILNIVTVLYMLTLTSTELHTDIFLYSCNQLIKASIICHDQAHFLTFDLNMLCFWSPYCCNVHIEYLSTSTILLHCTHYVQCTHCT